MLPNRATQRTTEEKERLRKFLQQRSPQWTHQSLPGSRQRNKTLVKKMFCSSIKVLKQI